LKGVYLALFVVGYLLYAGAVAGQNEVHAEEEGFEAPNIVLNRLDGKQFRLADFRGQWVMVNFWATWCGPCVEEMPSLDAFSQKYKKENLVVLAVSVDTPPKTKVEAFVKSFNLSFQVFLDPSSEMSDKFAVNSLPATFVINPEGMVVAHALGARNWMDPVIRDYFADLMSFGKETKSL
jgi:peroxiredoxin